MLTYPVTFLSLSYICHTYQKTFFHLAGCLNCLWQSIIGQLVSVYAHIIGLVGLVSTPPLIHKLLELFCQVPFGLLAGAVVYVMALCMPVKIISVRRAYLLSQKTYRLKAAVYESKLCIVALCKTGVYT